MPEEVEEGGQREREGGRERHTHTHTHTLKEDSLTRIVPLFFAGSKKWT